MTMQRMIRLELTEEDAENLIGVISNDNMEFGFGTDHMIAKVIGTCIEQGIDVTKMAGVEQMYERALKFTLQKSLSD